MVAPLLERVVDVIEYPAPAGRRLRVALAGCGTVGGALVELLEARAPSLASHHGTAVELTRVLVRGSDRCRPAPPELLTTDLEEFLAAPADVVVEAIGGTDTARIVAEHALRSGAHFVTANKQLVAERGPALAQLARANGGRFDFEAAVAGGIPVVRALREQLAPGGIATIRGILNGTTNFILDAMSGGERFADALLEAQRLGYAEADPSRDLSGADAADKLRILGWLAFGVPPASVVLEVVGAGPALDSMVAAARAHGAVVRLVAEVRREGTRVAGSVRPLVVPQGSALGAVTGAGNLVEVETAWGETIRWTGPGAGGMATASAVLGDVVRV